MIRCGCVPVLCLEVSHMSYLAPKPVKVLSCRSPYRYVQYVGVCLDKSGMKCLSLLQSSVTAKTISGES